MSQQESPPVRVLVIKLSSLGDLFHALPAVHNIKIGTNATIDWVVQSEYADVVRCFEDVERVIPFPRRSFFRDFASFRRDLRAVEYDFVVDLQGLMKSAAVGAMARSKRRIGPSFHREGSRMFYTEVAGQLNKNRHAVEETLDVVRHLDLELLSPTFPISFPLKKFDHPRPFIAVMPESRWKTKNWSVEYFVDSLKALEAKVGGTVFLAGAPEDRAACEQISEALGGTGIVLAGETSLVDLGSLLSRMDLVISNDSGPMHIAAAVGTPALALFGPTDPRRTGPYGGNCRTLKMQFPCQPCFSRECSMGDQRCMRDMPPAMVVDTALEMLGKYTR